MSVIQKINTLNGKSIDRAAVRELLRLAKEQEQPLVIARLEKVLKANPKVKDFSIKIKQPVIEVVPDSFLHCLECKHHSDDKITGLGKPVSPNEIYQMITDRMIQLIAEANTKDYTKKWQGKWYGKGYLIPFNFSSKKAYRGVNRFLLTDFEPLENPFYLTFKQVEELGGKVKKGAKGREVVYFTQLFRYQHQDNKVDVASYDRKQFIEQLKAHKDKIPMLSEGLSPEAIAEQSALPILKYYKVFNGKDVDGIDFGLDSFKIGFVEKELPAMDDNRLTVAESIIKHYPEVQPAISFGGDDAFYKRKADSVQMPHLADFDTVQDYYRTFFHELSHSTAHPTRLERKMGTRFGDKDYAFEELIAEFSATFLSAEAGIIWHNDKNHAAYLKSWNSALTFLKDDNRFLMRAATKAQASADYILNLDKKGEPAYIKDIKKVVKKQVSKPVKKTPSKKKKDTDQLSLALNGRKTKPRVKGLSAPDCEAQVPVVPVELYTTDNGSRCNGYGVYPDGRDCKGCSDCEGKYLDDSPEAQETEVIADPVPAVKPAPRSNNPRVQKIGGNSDQVSQFFTVAGETAKFLQRVERKPKGSVVITVDGPQGAGKTTMLYQMMNDFASPGNSSLFISGEEDPNSELAKAKKAKYISAKADANLDAIGEVESIAELYSLIAEYDVIFIDSWQKLQRMVGNIRLDEDLRKKFDGKVFVIIFQQTTTGRTKGGAEVVFDGDIITKMYKGERFNDNYAYFDKNRYTLVPLETLRYNIATATCYNPEAGQGEPEPEAEPIPVNTNTLKFRVV